MTIVVATLTVACSQDPYERYASAVRADASTAVLMRAIARLQLTIAHGRVPVTSAPVWTETLTRTSRDLAHHADHLARVGPPDSSFAASHAGLLDELRRAADTLSAVSASMTDSAAVGSALGRLMRGVEYTQDELRWTRERIARQLTAHGVIL